jgi:hypothetical protein
MSGFKGYKIERIDTRGSSLTSSKGGKKSSHSPLSGGVVVSGISTQSTINVAGKRGGLMTNSGGLVVSGASTLRTSPVSGGGAGTAVGQGYNGYGNNTTNPTSRTMATANSSLQRTSSLGEGRKSSSSSLGSSLMISLQRSSSNPSAPSSSVGVVVSGRKGIGDDDMMEMDESEDAMGGTGEGGFWGGMGGQGGAGQGLPQHHQLSPQNCALTMQQQQQQQQEQEQRHNLSALTIPLSQPSLSNVSGGEPFSPTHISTPPQDQMYARQITAPTQQGGTNQSSPLIVIDGANVAEVYALMASATSGSTGRNFDGAPDSQGIR